MTNIEVIDLAREILNEDLESSRAFPDNTSSFFKDTTLVRYFNQAQQELGRTVIQSFENYFVTESTINVSAGNDTYALPSTFIKMLRVEDVRNSTAPLEIYPISLNEKEGYRFEFPQITSATGEPSRYIIKGQSLMLRPIPNYSQQSGISLWYEKRILNMTANTASNGATGVSEIPIEFHEALAWGMCIKMAIQQQSDPSIYQAEFLRIKEDMKKELELRQVQLPRKVKERERL